MLYTGTVAKSQLISTIINNIISSGFWSNVASAPADGYVLKSLGSSGSDALFVIFNDTALAGTASAQNFVANIAENYVPGDPGIAGAFTNKSADANCYICSNTGIDLNTKMDYWVEVTADRIVLAVQTIDAIGHPPAVFYFGLPIRLFTVDSGSNQTMTILGSNVTGFNAVANQVKCLKDVTGTLWPAYTEFYMLTPKNPDVNGNYNISELYFGNTNIGLRGKLDTFFILPNQNIVNKDTLTVNTTTYKVFITSTFAGVTTFDNFPTTAFAVKIA